MRKGALKKDAIYDQREKGGKGGGELQDRWVRGESLGEEGEVGTYHHSAREKRERSSLSGRKRAPVERRPQEKVKWENKAQPRRS